MDGGFARAHEDNPERHTCYQGNQKGVANLHRGVASLYWGVASLHLLTLYNSFTDFVC